jgi:acetyltransferase-like isoleucine patch superfamily enzyme
MQLVVCAASAAPATLLWIGVTGLSLPLSARVLLYPLLIAPSYVSFALLLLVVSPAINRLTRSYSPPGLRTRIADFEWPLLRWARYMVAGHIVRTFSGTLFRGSPLWTFYLRLDGARIGRRVFINTLGISDHNLLVIGDDVTIGADVHISGHTVEHGELRTGSVVVGKRVTIGLDCAVGIDTAIGDGCEIGAMSLIPKHAVLEPGGVYAGIPIRRLTDTTRRAA